MQFKNVIEALSGIVVTGSVTATNFIKSGGTSSQFLKADGSVDSNTYATTASLANVAYKNVNNNFSVGQTINGTLSVTGAVTGSNLSGINTGDQDLSGYLTTTGNGSGLTNVNAVTLEGQPGTHYLNYNNLTNKPSLFSGSYNDLTNKPTIINDTGLPAILNTSGAPSLTTGITAAEVRSLIGAGTGDGTSNFSGSYNDLTNKPTIVNDTGVPAILSDGSVPSLNTGISAAEVRSLIGAGTSSLALGTTSTTALRGDTTTITTAQADAIVANSAKVTDTGKPAILSNGSNNPILNTGITAAEVRTLIGAGTGSSDFDGNYNSLTNKPTIINDTGLPAIINSSNTPSLTGTITGADIRSLIGAGTGDGTSNFSGSYNDLTNKPTIVNDTGVPAILSNGTIPSLNSGITAAEVRSLIGAGTSSLTLGTTSSTALAGNTTTISTAQANAITANSLKVSDTGTPAILSNGSVPSLNSGISAAEVRSLIGAQVSGSYQPAGNYFTDGDTVLNMANNDGFEYDDATNKMYVKLDGTNREIYHTGNFNPSNYQPAGTYNTVIGTDSDIDTSGATIVDNIFVTDGVITSMGTRVLTLADLGYVAPTIGNGTLTVQGSGALSGSGTFTANQTGNTTISITHDSYTARSINTSGASVLDTFTSDGSGHVTGITTRTLTLADLGYTGASNADANQNAFSSIKVGTTTIAADNPTDQLELIAGSNVTLTPNATNDSVTISSTNTNTTYSAGSGISLSGTTFSHTDTSTQSSVNNSGRTYIQDITLDTYGHVTGITSATETVVNTDTNYYLTGLSYDSVSSILTATVTGAPGGSVDLTNKIYADALAVSGNGSTSQYLRSDGDGTFTWATPSNTTNFNIQANSGTQVNISTGEEVNFVNGTNTTAVVVNQSNPTVTFNMNTGGIGAGTYGSTSDGTKIDQITVDAYGRVTGVTTGPISSLSNYVTTNTTQTITGEKTFNSSLKVQDPNPSTNGSLTIQHNSSGSSLTSNPGSNNSATVALTLGVNYSEKMRISSSGNVGIGDTDPDASLTVLRQSTSYAISLGNTESRAGLSVKSSTNFDSKLTISSGAGSRQYIQGVNNAATVGRDIVLNPYGGNVGIGATSPGYKLDVGGTGRFTSTVTATNFILSSDERKKTKIKDLPYNNINVNWKSFEFKEDEGEYRTGVIAQELEKSHPEFVNTDDEGFKSVKYIDLLIAKIAELEARLEKLER